MPPSALSGASPSAAQLDLLRLGQGGHRAAVMFTLIETAKLAGADPKAWLADVLPASPIIRKRCCKALWMRVAG